MVFKCQYWVLTADTFTTLRNQVSIPGGIAHQMGRKIRWNEQHMLTGYRKSSSWLLKSPVKENLISTGSNTSQKKVLKRWQLGVSEVCWSYPVMMGKERRCHTQVVRDIKLHYIHTRRRPRLQPCLNTCCYKNTINFQWGLYRRREGTESNYKLEVAKWPCSSLFMGCISVLWDTSWIIKVVFIHEFHIELKSFPKVSHWSKKNFDNLAFFGHEDWDTSSGTWHVHDYIWTWIH